jgi:ribosomal protein S18 acetylase RimI-like enzyme
MGPERAVVESARPAEVADLKRIVDLARQAVEELRQERGGSLWARREARREPMDASLAGMLTDETQHLVVGTLDGVILGFGSVRSELLADGDRLAVVGELYTDPGARAVGIGEAMMDALVGWAREHECIGVDALALPGTRETKNFFETFGLTARAIIVHRDLRQPPH